MHFLQLFLIAAGLSLISWASSEGIVTREYLPPVTTRKFLHTSHYPSHYTPSYYNQYQQQNLHHQQYYPVYNTGYYPNYLNGGGYQQHGLGSSLGVGGGYQQLGLGSSLGVGGGYYPTYPSYHNSVSISGQRPKPKIEVIDTVYDADNGGYVYAKKK